MRRAGSAVAAVAVVLSACGPATPPTVGPSTGSSGAASAEPTAAASPTPTPPPAVTKRFTIEPESVVDTALLTTHDLYVNPGALIESDGVLHMFPNSFSKFPGRVRVPHLTSSDGVTWTLDTEAEVLDTETEGLFPMAQPGIDVSTGFLTDDGTWVLLLEDVTLPGGPPWRVYRMTARAPQGPWTVDPDPVIDVGTVAAFDSAGVTWPSVVRIGDRWAAYYTGLTGPGRGTGRIGVAFSDDDGATWTKHPEPVLDATEQWELRALDRPRVVATPDGLVMVYTALDLNRRALATSTDGTTWTKVPGPSIVQEDFPLQGASWDAALHYADGELVYFLEIGNQTTEVYRATLPWP